MTDAANDPQAVRPEVVSLLLDIDRAAGGIDNGAACHANGRLLDPGELALIHSRTPAEERAVAALIDAGWQRWHRRSEALAKITAIIGEAPPPARANFDAALWACALPRDLAAMTPRQYAAWLDTQAPLTARVARATILPDLPPPLREEAERLLRSLIPPAHDCAIARVTARHRETGSGVSPPRRAHGATACIIQDQVRGSAHCCRPTYLGYPSARGAASVGSSP